MVEILELVEHIGNGVDAVALTVRDFGDDPRVLELFDRPIYRALGKSGAFGQLLGGEHRKAHQHVEEAIGGTARARADYVPPGIRVVDERPGSAARFACSNLDNGCRD
ncbi:hypothetical protein D6T64_02125 [Cryobacterium melibiosiphilum]|uniref:Uncharacterized protein n=1 Tax=Cryobacterium melibiosiphilum TaxID=995039 RepID=A0A3A5MVM2_9MICO|nr:hypothetical protein [Cryobacterium melibiosiphilum]RJT91313.1 hypothetical protein D6T64_02125 [Cryobacterium melibiosiphilum]